MMLEQSNWPPLVKGFFDRHSDWLPSFASDVPVGWDQHVTQALTALHLLQSETGTDLHLSQVKQKWGELRIYVNVNEASARSFEIVAERSGRIHMRPSTAPGSVRERVMKIVDEAAERCSRVCEVCGQEGWLHKRGGYVFVSCAGHSEGGVVLDDVSPKFKSLT